MVLVLGWTIRNCPFCKSKWSNIRHFICFNLILEKLKDRWGGQVERQLLYAMTSFNGISTGSYRKPKEGSEPEPGHQRSLPRRSGISKSWRMGRGSQGKWGRRGGGGNKIVYTERARDVREHGIFEDLIWSTRWVQEGVWWEMMKLGKEAEQDNKGPLMPSKGCWIVLHLEGNEEPLGAPSRRMEWSDLCLKNTILVSRVEAIGQKGKYWRWGQLGGF